MFGCLISPTGFQNAREVQGAFFLKISQNVFRFSEKNIYNIQMAGGKFLYNPHVFGEILQVLGRGLSRAGSFCA
jgi:hypothetical protein